MQSVSVGYVRVTGFGVVGNRTLRSTRAPLPRVRERVRPPGALKCVSGDLGIVAPDFLQQGLTRYRTWAGTIEISQDPGLLVREPHLAAVRIEQDLGPRPECIGADGEDGVLARLVLAQLRTNAREQHGKAKRLVT
jgi:hypothetical protein